MASKKWNWQQDDWPHFRHDKSKLEKLEAEFLRQSGILTGTIKFITDEDKSRLTIDLISNEALKTSEIEGEILNRDSLQSSIRRNFGLGSDHRRIPPAEQGIAEMMSDLYHNFRAPLTHENLYRWHTMLMSGRRDLKDVGSYRTGEQPMQVVSGPIHEPKVHFEAPPSSSVFKEMVGFISWFNGTAPDGKHSVPALTRAGMAHQYFVCIHPFEDGNGRVARALSERALSQALEEPTLIALSQTINSRRKAYYDALERNNKRNEITDWLAYFAKTILDAQEFTQKIIDLVIAKTKFFDRFRGELNARQEKVIARMFREEPDGFKGGLSAENYIRIAGTSRATATRDLQDLVEKKALSQKGTLKSTRYYLRINV